MSLWMRWLRCSPNGRSLVRMAVLLLALMLALDWPASMPSVAQDACGAFAVATAPQQIGHPLSDNAVMLSTSAGEGAPVGFEEPRTVEPSPKRGVALVRSLGGIYALMDIATGAMTPLAIPEADQPRVMTTYATIRNASQADFMLMTSGPDAVWLVDLSSGDAVELTNLPDDGSSIIESASISPNGDWLIYFARDAGYLLSLETPGLPQPIDSNPILAFPGFDEESNVIYGVGEGENTTIRSLEPATGERTDLVKAPGVRIVPLRQGGPTFLMNASVLMVLDPGADEPRVVFEWQGEPSSVMVDAAGAHLLVADELGEQKWFWVDLDSGSRASLPDLAGMTPVGAATIRDSVLFAPTAKVTPGNPGAPYRTFDLATGTVTTVLEQDSDDVYQARAAGDDAGRFSIVNAVSPGSGRVWLVDSLNGTAELVATSTGNADARVSPDGCQLAVAVFDTVGEGRTSTVTVVSLIDGAPLLTIPNALLLGWAETNA